MLGSATPLPADEGLVGLLVNQPPGGLPGLKLLASFINYFICDVG